MSKLKGYKIGIDIGHGGKDSGAVGGGLKEKDEVLKIGLLLEKELRKLGANVVMTRSTDKWLPLKGRTELLNKAKTDFNISLHMNYYKESKANGLETWYFTYSDKGYKLASSIQTRLKTLFKSDRGIKHNTSFVMLKGTVSPTALIEIGFISNNHDRAIVSYNHLKIANLITNGILDYLGKPITSQEDISNQEDISKPSTWAREEWEKAIKLGLTDGSRPRGVATREEVITMIVRSKDL